MTHLARRTVLGVILVCAVPVASAQELFREIFGGDPGGCWGEALTTIGDADCDGTPDYIIGAPRYGATDGGHYQIFTGATGSVMQGSFGIGNNQQTGKTLNYLGDLDGDGWGDAIIATPNGTYFGGPPQIGTVSLYSWKLGTAHHVIYGEDSFDDFGWAAAAVGDVNLDGYVDVIVGAPQDDNLASNCGKVTVYSGWDVSVLYTFDGADVDGNLGQSVSAAGDVNADGYPDFIVGEPGGQSAGVAVGKAHVYSGMDGSLLHSIVSSLAGSRLGEAVAEAGDVNLDTQADWAVGAPIGSSGGEVQVRDGGVIYSLVGSMAGSQFGAEMRTAGDVNGDGWIDLLIGAPSDDTGGTNCGSAHLVSGRTGRVLYMFRGESGAQLGTGISTAQDMNGDGLDDVLIGSPAEGTSGAARIYLGNDLFLNAERKSYSAGETLELSVGEGQMGDPIQLFIVDVNGFPVSIPLLTGLMDASGGWDLSSPVLGGYGPLTITFRAFALVGGEILVSADETVFFDT